MISAAGHDPTAYLEAECRAALDQWIRKQGGEYPNPDGPDGITAFAVIVSRTLFHTVVDRYIDIHGEERARGLINDLFNRRVAGRANA